MVKIKFYFQQTFLDLKFVTSVLCCIKVIKSLISLRKFFSLFQTFGKKIFQDLNIF